MIFGGMRALPLVRGIRLSKLEYSGPMNPHHFDVIVLGAGVAGSAAAYKLAATQRVLVLEQFDFLHAQGSSHGGSRIFRHAYEDTRYVKLAQAADELWQALEHDANDKLLYRTGGLDIGGEAHSEMLEVQAALHQAERPFEVLSPTETARRFPAFRLPENNVAVYQKDAGILAATRCVNALLRVAAARGASLRDNEAVTGLELDQDHVEVRTAKGRYQADKLVITAGPWLGEVIKSLSAALHIEQQQVLYLKVNQAETFASGMPLFINRDPDATVYGFPLFDRPNAIKVSDHANAPTITFKERLTELMGERAKETVRNVQTFLPDATGELIHHELCLYTKTPDEHFILDKHPEFANVVIGGGFSGHGFKFGPVLGEILRDLVLEGRSKHDLSLFGLGRLLPEASLGV